MESIFVPGYFDLFGNVELK